MVQKLTAWQCILYHIMNNITKETVDIKIVWHLLKELPNFSLLRLESNLIDRHSGCSFSDSELKFEPALVWRKFYLGNMSSRFC